MPTSSRCTSATCAARSTARSAAHRSRPSAVRATGSATMAAEGQQIGTMRARITALAAGAVGIAVVVAAALLLVVLHRQLVANTDASLRARVDDIEALVRQHTLPPLLPGTGDDGNVAQVTADGVVLSRSADI